MTSPNFGRRRFFSTSAVALLALGSLPALVSAALEGGKMPSPNLEAIVRKIAPAVDRLRVCGTTDTVLGLAVEANVRQSARTLLENSAILREELGAGKLTLVRAVYRLKSGEVDRLPDEA